MGAQASFVRFRGVQQPSLLRVPPAAMDPLACLQSVRGETDITRRAEYLKVLQSSVKSGEFRDVPFTKELYRSLFSFLASSLSWRGEQGQSDAVAAERIFWEVTRFPEFDTAVANAELTDDFMWSLSARCSGTASPEEFPFLRFQRRRSRRTMSLPRDQHQTYLLSDFAWAIGAHQALEVAVAAASSHRSLPRALPRGPCRVRP